MKYKQPVRYIRRDEHVPPDQSELGKTFLVILIVATLIFTGLAVYINHLREEQHVVENYIFPPVSHPLVLINDDNGSISIHSQKHGPYGFNAMKFASNFGMGLSYITVDYIQVKATARINIHSQVGPLSSNSEGVDLDVFVPPTADVHIYTAHGNINLAGMQGNISAEVKNGSLSMMKSTGSITLLNDTGSVMAQHVQGQLHVVAGDGNIVLHDVLLKKQSLLQASGGAITLQGELEHNSHVVLQAHPGPVTLIWPAATAYRLHIEHGSGQLNNEFGHLVHGKSGRQADVTVGTDNTMIRIQKVK